MSYNNIRKYFNQMFKAARQKGMKYFNTKEEAEKYLEEDIFNWIMNHKI